MEISASIYPVASLYSRNRVSGDSPFAVDRSPLRAAAAEKKLASAASPLPGTDSVELSRAASQTAALYPFPTQNQNSGAPALPAGNAGNGSAGAGGDEQSPSSESAVDGEESGVMTEGEGKQTDKNGKQAAASGETNAKGEPLSDEEQAQLDKLKARDREVRQHEQAHMAVGGGYAGAPSYEYQQGPDGGRYAVGGEVSIDMSPEKDPKATAAKMRQVKAAALAPAQPSSQDLSVAAQASQLEAQAQAEGAKGTTEQDGGASGATDSAAKEGDGSKAAGAGAASGEQSSGSAVPTDAAAPSTTPASGQARPGAAAEENSAAGASTGAAPGSVAKLMRSYAPAGMRTVGGIALPYAPLDIVA